MASEGSSGSLSSMGRDQGSIGSDRESVLRFWDRSGLEVGEDEAMSRSAAAPRILSTDTIDSFASLTLGSATH